MQPNRRIPKIALSVSAAFVGVALLWTAFAVPRLVKYPTDLDVRPRYHGTFILYVDPATAAPLATPRRVPLDIERHIRSLSDESNASRVVVREDIRQRAGGLFDATQTNVYVMDRRTMQNVADERAYAFDPSNVTDRSGAYRLNLPFHVSSDAAYPIYKNEIATTYEVRAKPSAPTTDVAGLHLRNFTGSAAEVPLDPAYLAELDKIVTLPTSLTLDQLEPQLEAAGLDVDAVFAALAPVITADDLATLARIAAKPIALQYVMSFTGDAGVEMTTGAELDVRATAWVGAKPVLTDGAALQAVLAHYPDVPEAVAAGEALTELRSAPATKLFEYHYQQTPASVVDVASEVKSLRGQVRLVERYVPWSLYAAAVTSLVIGASVHRRRRPRTDPAIDLRSAQPAGQPAHEKVPTSSGSAR
jgi:hypothetical protein